MTMELSQTACEADSVVSPDREAAEQCDKGQEEAGQKEAQFL